MILADKEKINELKELENKYFKIIGTDVNESARCKLRGELVKGFIKTPDMVNEAIEKLTTKIAELDLKEKEDKNDYKKVTNSIKVTDYKGKELEGEWNQKFYNSQIEEAGTYRIYIDNECIHITEEEKERLIKESSNNKIEEDNKRIGIVLKEIEKMDDNARQKLIEHLVSFYNIEI